MKKYQKFSLRFFSEKMNGLFNNIPKTYCLEIKRNILITKGLSQHVLSSLLSYKANKVPFKCDLIATKKQQY